MFNLHLQDPLDPPSSQFLPKLAEVLRDNEPARTRAFFGFATGRGIEALLATPEIEPLFTRLPMRLTVGLDSVTDRYALRLLQDLSTQNTLLDVSVVNNATAALIHPKLLYIEYAEGGGSLWVGSNNLTPGGLGSNVEAYSVWTFSEGDKPDLTEWNTFEKRWAEALSEINQTALERALRNQLRSRGKRRQSHHEDEHVPDLITVDGTAIEIDANLVPDQEEPVLVAQVPRAGNRWSQVHFNIDIARNFFGSDPDQHPYIRLRQAGQFEVESRTVVYAESNRNVKIEFAAAAAAQRHYGYPGDEDRPIIVSRCEDPHDRRFVYTLLFPDDPGYTEMKELSDRDYRGPGNQVPRILVPRSRVLAYWPDLPL